LAEWARTSGRRVAPLTIRQSMRFGAMAVNGFVIEPVRVAATLVA
jgi:hypothetical protein